MYPSCAGPLDGQWRLFGVVVFPATAAVAAGVRRPREEGTTEVRRGSHSRSFPRKQPAGSVDTMDRVDGMDGEKQDGQRERRSVKGRHGC